MVANFPITHLGILDGVAEDEAEPLEHDHEDKVQHKIGCRGRALLVLVYKGEA